MSWIDNHKPGLNTAYTSQNPQVLTTISSTKSSIDTRLNVLWHVYDFLKEVEKNEKGFRFRQDTLEAIFSKYPSLSFSKFKEYFFCNTYNKNILMNAPELIDFIDLENIKPWTDLIEIVTESISISKEDFENKVKWKFDVLTFPNLSSTDVAQWYFFNKLKFFLPDTKIIFWDMQEIRENLWKNQFNSDSVWFIDLMWNWLFNTCLFKLFKTNPDPKKVDELNNLFSDLEKDVFIGWSTYNIPFSIPEDMQAVSMPKMQVNNKPLTLKNWVLLNAMWYLNSAYYCDKSKWSFVLWSHNIAEPMHAWKLTVINNDLENRYNHNWLISYFWEKTWLLLYFDSKTDDQNSVDSFLSTSREELENRYEDFQRIYHEKIINLVYGIFYRFLLKNFPDKFI